MSSEENTNVSGDEVVTFEMLPELNEGAQGAQSGQTQAQGTEQVAGQNPASQEPGNFQAYPKTPCPYVNSGQCPAKSYGIPDKAKGTPAKAKSCDKLTKFACPYMGGGAGKAAAEGTSAGTIPQGTEQTNAAKPPTQTVTPGVIQDAKPKDGECGAGEVWDEKKKKCVPVKEALAERDTAIQDLSTRLNKVTDELRMKKIETNVDEQIAAGHLAPVQRVKAISFLAGLPDEKQEDLLGIFAHQKFPLGQESGGQTQGAPTKKDEIGDSESAENLSDKAKKFIMEKHGLTEIFEEKGYRKTAGGSA